MSSYNKVIQVKRGDSPKLHDVLNLLVNTVFYVDGAPWQPTTEQIAGLAEGDLRPLAHVGRPVAVPVPSSNVGHSLDRNWGCWHSWNARLHARPVQA